MNPSLALGLWFILLVALFWFDPAKEPHTSAVLWVPLTWFFFLASRPPAMWLGFSSDDAAQALQDGNPIDRAILSLLMLACIVILLRRSFQWREFFAHNTALTLFLFFALISCMWSDFPLVTLKKCFRDTGIYMAALVVASDRDRIGAVRTVLRRLCYLVIPLSVVLVKYFPAMGKTYSPWGGQEYTGVSTSKNMLGAICLVSGIFFFWDTLARWHERKEPMEKRILLLNGALLGMTVYLLNLSASSTSTICLILGCLMIAVAHSKFGQRHTRWIKALAPISFITYLVLAVGLGLGGELSQAVGKSANMSDRTHIWEVLLSVPINPVLGTGYQSFWLGSRVDWVWARLNGDNVLEAHNGYLGIYLELGVVGLLLLVAFLVATYRKVCKQLDPLTPFGSLGLGLWTLLLFYNVSEAAFGGGVLWIILLLSSVTLPQYCEGPQVEQASARGLAEPGADASFEMTSSWG